MVLVLIPVTSPDHVVDQKWSLGVPRLSLYILVSEKVIFLGEHNGGGAGCVPMTTPDHVVDHI